MKADAEMNNIDKELDDLSLTGFVISAIFGMEGIPDDAWNIGMESNKYRAGQAKRSGIDIYYIKN